MKLRGTVEILFCISRETYVKTGIEDFLSLLVNDRELRRAEETEERRERCPADVI